MTHIDSEFQAIKDQLEHHSLDSPSTPPPPEAAGVGHEHPPPPSLKTRILTRLGMIERSDAALSPRGPRRPPGLWALALVNLCLTVGLLVMVLTDLKEARRALVQERGGGEITLGDISIQDAVQLDRPRYITDQYCVLFLSKSLLTGNRLFLDWASKERLANTTDEYRVVNSLYCKNKPALPLPQTALPKALITPVERKYCCYDGVKDGGGIKGVWLDSCDGKMVLRDSICEK